MIPAFEQFRAAAEADPPSVAALIDWPVSGASRLVRAAAELDPGDRAALVARGVAELLADDRKPMMALAAELAYLNEQPVLVEAAPAQDAFIREELRVPALPDEIYPADREILDRLAMTSRSITDTALLRFGGDRQWGLAAGAFARVAVVRSMPPDGAISRH